LEQALRGFNGWRFVGGGRERAVMFLDATGMTPQGPARQAAPEPEEIARLIREVELYLRAVDAFRRAGCPPRWR
jgi:hypothetical protein